MRSSRKSTRSRRNPPSLTQDAPRPSQRAHSAGAACHAPVPGLAQATPTPPVPPAGAERLQGLDGLRAVAVVAVLLYHLGLPHVADAGFLGVDVFFTISGFIITALLLREHGRTGGLNFLAFYRRRARRLLPPTFVMVAVVATLSPLLAPQAVQRLGSDIPAAALYVSNWWQIFSHQSYFENFDNPALLQHLWSLAVEEQYYIVWPLCVWGVLRVSGRRWLALVSLALALASTAWMAWLYEIQIDGGDPSRVYLGTDTHLMGLLLGSALACVFDPWRPAGQRWLVLAQRRAAGHPMVALGAWGGAALLGLLAMVGLLNDAEPLVYRGGLLGAAVLSAAALVAAVQPGTWVQRGLGGPLVQWAGTRSFSLYLWHWPIFVWLRPAGDAMPELVMVTAARLVLTVWAAELSYQLVERTAHAPPAPAEAAVAAVAAETAEAAEAARAVERAAAATTAACAATATPAARRWMPRGAVLAGALVAVVSTALVVAGPAPPPAAGATLSTLQSWPLEALAPGRGELLAESEPPSTSLRPVVWLRGTQQPAWGPLAPVLGAEPDTCINVIGDSVMLGAREHLGRTIAGVRVDAEVGRQGSQGVKLLKEFRAHAVLCNSVVVHLGTNGYLSETHYREMLKQLQDRPVVVLVNIHANRHWTAANNRMIARVGREFQNTRVVDWHALSDRRPEFFVSDGVHLSGTGIQAMAREIRRAVGLADSHGNAHGNAHGDAAGEAPGAAPAPSYRAALQERKRTAAAAASQPAGAQPLPAQAEPEAPPPKPTSRDG